MLYGNMHSHNFNNCWRITFPYRYCGLWAYLLVSVEMPDMVENVLQNKFEDFELFWFTLKIKIYEYRRIKKTYYNSVEGIRKL